MSQVDLTQFVRRLPAGGTQPVLARICLVWRLRYINQTPMGRERYIYNILSGAHEPPRSGVKEHLTTLSGIEQRFTPAQS